MTTPSTIDLDAATVTREVHIDAPREVVWAVLTTPDQLALWFGDRSAFPEGVHRGAIGVLGWTAYGDFPARIDEYVPTRRFAFTWGVPGEEIREDNSTTATFHLSDALTRDGGTSGTVLTVVETGFDTLSVDALARRAGLEDHAEGWNEELDNLVSHLGRVTSSSGAVADPERGTITRTVLVRADPATTWGALTDPAAIEEWWGHPAAFPEGITAGARGTLEMIGHGRFPIHVQRFEPTVRFAFRWGRLHESEPGPDAQLVTFTLTDAGAETLVSMIESGFDSLDRAARRAAMEENVDGWNTALDGFRRHVVGARA